MMIIRMVAAFLLLYMSNFAFSSPMPTDSNIPFHYYQKYMTKKNCSPIKDFYHDRPFVFDPPYLVTDNFLSGKQVLIMACETSASEKNENYKIIVFVRDLSTDPFSKYGDYKACSSEILSEFKIGGLSVATLSASDERPLKFSVSEISDSGKKIVPKEITVTDKKIVIRESSGGGMVDHLCFKGGWYYRISH